MPHEASLATVHKAKHKTSSSGIWTSDPHDMCDATHPNLLTQEGRLHTETLQNSLNAIEIAQIGQTGKEIQGSGWIMPFCWVGGSKRPSNFNSAGGSAHHFQE